MKRVWMIASVLLIPTMAWAWPWTRDMMNQPSIKPQEPPIRAYPKDSVPTDGPWTKVADRDAAEEIKNPVPPTPESIRMGAALFRVYCLPCHGSSGKGDGLVGKVFELQPTDLTSDYVKELTDGWIWGTITFGSYIMPRYGYDTTPEERWHIVNFIRRVLERPMKAKSKQERAAEIKETVAGQGKE